MQVLDIHWPRENQIIVTTGGRRRAFPAWSRGRRGGEVFVEELKVTPEEPKKGRTLPLSLGALNR